MAIKASNQMTLIDLTDGYSVVLSNDSHTFLGNNNGALSINQTATITVQAICGSTIVPCSVDTSTITKPTGISISSDGKSPSPTLTVTASTAVTVGGAISLPVVVNNNGDTITINKQFSYSIARMGATGKTGATGATGNGIASVTEYYGLSTKSDTEPTSYSETVPVMTSTNKYLWNYERTTYTNGNTKDTAKRIIGVYGTTGGQGVSITGVTNKYLATNSASGVTTSTSGWTDAVQSVSSSKKYLWNYEIVSFSNGKTSSSTPGIIGAYGDTGPKGATGAAGADAISLVVESSNGSIFKNTAVATVLTAKIYKAGARVTGDALKKLGTVKWYKDGGTTSVATGETLTISAGDVDNRATYAAQLEG